MSLSLTGCLARRTIQFSPQQNSKGRLSPLSSRLRMRPCANISPASIHLPEPEGKWIEITGGVAAAKGFAAGGLQRAKGDDYDLSLVFCDGDATAAGVFTSNPREAGGPVKYCKKVLNTSTTASAVLTFVDQANDFGGDEGYEEVEENIPCLAQCLKLNPAAILFQSSGVTRIKKDAFDGLCNSSLITSFARVIKSLSESSGNEAAQALTNNNSRCQVH